MHFCHVEIVKQSIECIIKSENSSFQQKKNNIIMRKQHFTILFQNQFYLRLNDPDLTGYLAVSFFIIIIYL